MTNLMIKLTRLWRGGTEKAVPEVKASRGNALIALHTSGTARWTPRNYEAMAREGFAQNAIGYRAVRMIAEAAASLPWLLYEQDQEQDTHRLLDLLRKPNPVQSGRQLLEAYYGHLQVSGNAYLEACMIGDEVRELHVLRADRMKVVPGRSGWPEAYEYAVNGRTVRFAQDGDGPVEPILHTRLFNPLDDHYGMSPLEAGAKAIDIHNAAGAWNKSLLDNGARPSGALIYRGEPGAESLSEEQFARLKSELEGAYQGTANAGRPMVLEGGLEWKPLSHSPKELGHIEAKHDAAREIALAFGVPPMLLGIPGDNTFANYAEANRTFWRQTVLPLAQRTAEDLTNWLAPAFDSDLRLDVDTDQVDALAADRQSAWTRVNQAGFLTMNEKRAALGYSPVEGGDELPGPQ